LHVSVVECESAIIVLQPK